MKATLSHSAAPTATIRVLGPDEPEAFSADAIRLEINLVRHPAASQALAISPATASPPEPLLLRIEEAAEQLAISRTALYAMLGKDIAVVRVGRSVRVPRSALIDFVARSLDCR